MNPQNLEERIIAYFEGDLEETDQKKLMSEVENSSETKSLFEIYQKMYHDFEIEELAMPSEHFKKRFYESIEAKPLSNKSSSGKIKRMQLPFLKYAAAILILVTVGILIGLNISKNKEIDEMGEELLAMKNEMKTLLQNESTVQRIRAVKMSHEFSNPDEDILKTLIRTMNSDKSENVRIAAIEALSNFSYDKMVQRAFLKTLEKSEEDFIQIKLIKILAEAKNKKMLPYLNKILEDKKTSRYLKTEATQGKKTIINL